MKKSVTLKVASILLVELVYLFSYHTVYDFLGLNRWVGGLGQYKLATQIFLEEIPIILILLLLNLLFWRQKLLFKKFPFFTGLAISAYGFLAFLTATVAALALHRSIGLFGLTLVATLFIGVAEELLMRGLVLGSLIAKGKSLRFSVLLSSLLFALLHSVNILHQPLLNTVLQVIYVFPMGIFLAAVYLRTNNLFYPIILHGLQDFVAIIASNGAISTVTSPMPVVQTYLIYLTMAFAVTYARPEQLRNFVNRLRNLPLEKVKISLPRLALSKKFRLTMIAVTMGYGVVAYIVYVVINALQKLPTSSSSQSFSSAFQAGLNSAQSQALPSQIGFLMMSLSVASYVFLITFFNYRRTHLFWLLIPFVGGPVFAIVALAGGFVPMKTCAAVEKASPGNLPNLSNLQTGQ